MKNKSSLKNAPPLFTSNRRQFLVGATAITAATLLPVTISCTAEIIEDVNHELDSKSFETLIAVQNHLFPAYKDSPSALDINAAAYFTWVLTDTKKDSEEKEFMRNGIIWTNETAQENFSKSFFNLNTQEKEKTLRIMASESWGENWISVVLTFIFEALLSDPIYGSNNQETGWNWLEHKTGSPQPTEINKYKPQTT